MFSCSKCAWHAARLTVGFLGFLCGPLVSAGSVQVRAPVDEARFGTEVPPNWQLTGEWTRSTDGAVAGKDSVASRSGEVPERCLVEMIFDLPAVQRLEQKVTASLSLGPADDETQQLKASAGYQKVVGENPSFPYSVSLSGAGADGKRVTISPGGDMRPAVLREVSGGDISKGSSPDEAQRLNGWAGRTVSLGIALDDKLCRLLAGGIVVGEIAAELPSRRVVSVAGNGITLRAVRVLSGTPGKYVLLGGSGLALRNGGESHGSANGVTPGCGESAVVEIDGVPFLVQGAEEGRLATLDVSAEQWKRSSWSEGTGMPMAPLPHRWYSAAHLLLHLQGGSDKTPAMGFGLRVPEMSGGDLKNIYVGDVPVRSSDAGVTVRPVQELGPGWFLARVPINPAALQRFGSAAYFTRQWTAGGGIPPPYGKPSALRVAACTVEEADIEMSVEGNGLGNVYDEVARPRLKGSLRNRTASPVTVTVTTEVMPFEREPSRRVFELRLAPSEEETFEALAAPITDRGHYRVRVVADAGAAGRIEHRTNVAMLAPDTRTRIQSPFGCWHRLWDDRSTQQQSKYLKVKAGVDFWMGPHDQNVGKEVEVPDDAKAEEMAKAIDPEVRVFTFGWEHNWGLEHTFSFPRVIAEGRPEELPEEQELRPTRRPRTGGAWRERYASSART